MSLDQNVDASDSADEIDIDDVEVSLTAEEQLVERMTRDKDDLKLETFLLELEVMMISKESQFQIRKWARRFGIDRESLTRYQNIVRGTWKLEGTTMFVAEARRDELRQMYVQIWRESMERASEDPKYMAIALKTIDSMTELDGLKLPEITVNVNQSSDSTRSPQELTNQVRERTMQLMNKMRERAVAHAAKATKHLEESSQKLSAQEAQKLAQSDLVEIVEDQPRTMGVAK